MGKRKRNADFQKVKLKVGRSLRKGLNVTNTKFKSKKIKIFSQFKGESLEPKTHRKQTLEDLLKKCTQKNAAVCQESLIGIKELIVSNEDLIQKHLPVLIKQISESVINNDAFVRKYGCCVFSVIFQAVSEEEILPFFPILKSHLCCAMTHIDTEVRKDSLKLLEVLLDTLPTLICSSIDVLSNFVDQISVQRHDISSITGKNNQNRRLSVSPSDRLFSQDWRVRVLTTLAKFLQAVIEKMSFAENVPVTMSDFDVSKPMNYSVTNIKNLDELIDIKNFINTLIPLLFDTWIEAAPSPVIEQDAAEIVSPEAAKTMNCVLQVMVLLMEWISIADMKHNTSKLMSWFKDNFNFTISKRFMLWFPYSQRVCSRKGKQNRRIGTEVTCLSINLIICDMFSTLMLNGDKTLCQLKEKVLDYLLHVINRENGKTSLISTLLKIMKRTIKHMESGEIQQHLMGLFNMYKKLDFRQHEKEQLLYFFADLNTNFSPHILTKLSALQLWAQYLPNEIHLMAKNKYVHAPALLIMKKLAALSNTFFLDSLQQHSASIIALLQDEDEEIQCTMVHFIFSLPHISLETFIHLSNALRNPVVSQHNVCNLLDLLNHRILIMRDLGFIPGHYVSFLLCMGIGMSRSDEDDYLMDSEKFQQLTENVPFNLSDYSIIPSSNIERQHEITRAVIRCLKQFPEVENTVQCMHIYFFQFIAECSCFPVHAGLAFLSLECEVNEQKYDMSPVAVTTLSEICVGLLVYEYALDVMNESKKSETFFNERVFSHVCSLVKTFGNIGYICKILIVKLEENRDLVQGFCISHILLALLKENLFTLDELLPSFETLLDVLENLFSDQPKYVKWWNSMQHELSNYLNSSNS